MPAILPRVAPKTFSTVESNSRARWLVAIAPDSTSKPARIVTRLAALTPTLSCCSNALTCAMASLTRMADTPGKASVTAR